MCTYPSSVWVILLRLLHFFLFRNSCSALRFKHKFRTHSIRAKLVGYFSFHFQQSLWCLAHLQYSQISRRTHLSYSWWLVSLSTGHSPEVWSRTAALQPTHHGTAVCNGDSKYSDTAAKVSTRKIIVVHKQHLHQQFQGNSWSRNSKALFTQDAEADLHTNLHANSLMLLVRCVNTPIDHSVLHYLHTPVARCSASCANRAQAHLRSWTASSYSLVSQILHSRCIT